MALLSREEPREAERGLGDDEEDARVVSARVGDLRLISAYFPNGQVVGSEKWGYKLDWMRRFRKWLDWRFGRSEPVVLAGDFNVAPEARDVCAPAIGRGRSSSIPRPAARSRA